MPNIEDPIAARSEFLVKWFTRYLRWSISRNFHAVRMSRSGRPTDVPGRPVIVYTNHPSWWDPAIFYLLMQVSMPQRRGFGPMDSDSLEKYGVMKRLGIFGIDHSPRGAARFLQVSTRALADPGTALWITAEGHFTDARTRPVTLRPGIAHLARRASNATILPLAIEYPFWNESKPEVLVRFGAPLTADPAPSVAAWTVRLTEALHDTMNVLATESISRNSALFDVVRKGRVGIGGPYDTVRRLQAAIAGRRFDASHEGRET